MSRHLASCILLLSVHFTSYVSADAAKIPAETSPDASDAPRLVTLSGALNVRDLGGIDLKDGVLPYRRFVRAANLANLTDDDRQALYKLGIATDIDLRSHEEVAKAQDALNGDDKIRYINIPLFGGAGPEASIITSDLSTIYIQSLENYQQQFREIFEAIAHAASGAVLYHCTAGKDRTGMISAFLLSLGGTPRSEIVHNYAVSQYYLRPMMASPAMQEMVKSQPQLSALMGTPPAAIEAFLDVLDHQYGGAESYLRTIGLESTDIAAIRRRLAPN